MKYFRSRFKSSLEILETYNYPEPFHIHIKNHFSGHKKYGSKDRKAIADICYTYLRTGLLFKNESIATGLLKSSLLLEWEWTSDLNKVADGQGVNLNLEIDQLNENLSLKHFASYTDSEEGLVFYPSEYLMESFSHYNDIQNIRYRPRNWAKDHANQVQGKLGLLGAKEILVTDKLQNTVQVQDLSSQFICNEIQLNEGDVVWDLCCGSAGKTLNLSSKERCDFHMSDVRPGILENAKSRMKLMHYDASYGVNDLQKDLERLNFENKTVEKRTMDVIVADVPCSGSGTWFRTPEHFARFDYSSLDNYATRQKKIVENAIPFLKAGGSFYYITCSIFKEENTEVRDWILAISDLKLVREIEFDGMSHQSDCMYMAEFSS